MPGLRLRYRRTDFGLVVADAVLRGSLVVAMVRLMMANAEREDRLGNRAGADGHAWLAPMVGGARVGANLRWLLAQHDSRTL